MVVGVGPLATFSLWTPSGPEGSSGSNASVCRGVAGAGHRPPPHWISSHLSPSLWGGENKVILAQKMIPLFRIEKKFAKKPYFHSQFTIRLRHNFHNPTLSLLKTRLLHNWRISCDPNNG